MKRCHGLAALVGVLLLAGALNAQPERSTDPPVRPPVGDPTQPPGFPPGLQPPPGGFPGQPPGGPGGPGGPGFPGFPGQADHKELVSTLIDLLDDNDADVRASVAQALGRIGRQAVTPLTNLVKDKDKSASLRANAAYALGQIGPQAQDALPALSKAVKETDKELRKRAAFAIANIVTGDGFLQGLPPGIFGPGGGQGGFGGKTDGGRPGRDPGVVPPSNVVPDKKPEEKKPE